MTQSYEEKRALLAKVALQEGHLKLRGDENKAGLEIEKYLNVFRETFNRIDNTTKYSDTTIGFDWCCAFVYYCCLQAGYWFWALQSITGENPVKPEQRGRLTQMAEAWIQWGKEYGYRW
jgi:hypothetical protein